MPRVRVGQLAPEAATDGQVLAFNAANNQYEPQTGAGGGITEPDHRTLRALIHFIDEGPTLGFVTGATRVVTGTVFPTEVMWRTVGGNAIVRKQITYTGAFPTTITWTMYAINGTTVLETVTDTISYSGPFETSRVRAIA